MKPTNLHKTLKLKLIVAFTLLLSSFSITAFADDVTFTASAPQTVKVGEQFKLQFKLNVLGNNFTPPNITDLKIIKSYSQNNTNVVNGTLTRYTVHTFVLEADHEGKFTIPAASIQSDGKTYHSNPINIEVVQQQEENNAADDTTNHNLNSDDFFVVNSVDKNTLYQGQYLVATIKLYTRKSVANIEEVKYPPFKGFWSSDLEVPKPIKLQREVFNAQTYSAGLLKKVLLIPLNSGELTIDTMEITIKAQTRVSSNNSFYNFFGFGDSYRTTLHRLTSNPVNITVKPLPAGKPTNFSGGVGNFTLNASIDKPEVKANDTVMLKVEVAGDGNLKFINSVRVDFPRKFNVYDTVTTQNIKTDTNGMSGSVTFDYMFIPRKAGNYRLAPITFSYFDTKSETYKTLTTQEFNIKVEKSSGKSE